MLTRKSLHKLILALLILSLCLVSAAFAQEAQRDEPPKIIRKSGGVFQGSALRRVEPAYPPLAKAARISGSVVVEVTADEEGNVISVRAISGHPLLKDAAVAAARGWKFAPTMLSGVPVKVIGTITFNFNLGSPPNDEIKELEKQVAANPDSPELVHKLGLAYLGFFQEEKAIEAFKRAIELKPDFAEAHCDLGRAYHSLGRDDDALASADTALRIDPKSRSAVYANLLTGSILLKRERVQEAIASFKQALNIHSDSDDESDACHMGLAYAYIKAGDKQSALTEYEILRARDSAVSSDTKHLTNAIKHIKSLIDEMQ